MKTKATHRMSSQPSVDQAFVSFRIGVLQWMPEERFEKLMVFLRRHRQAADEVAFFTSGIHPVIPLQTIEERAALLAKRITAAKKDGYRAGINFLSTIGHCDEYLHLALKGNCTPMVGVDGSQSAGVFCPNCENLREYVRQAYAAVARANPDFIWLDDDVRICNHRPANNPCFCDNCLRIFSEECGVTYDRESLRVTFDRGAREEKRKIRLAWLEHNARSIERLLVLVEKTVHQIKPGLPLGLMTGDYYYERHNFDNRAEALAGPRKAPVMWRPGGGFYTDESMVGLIHKSHYIGHQIAPLPDQVVNIQSEIENFPYQPLKKACHSTVLEAAVYIAAGCTGAAYNVLQPWDEPLDEYEPLVKQLEKARPFLDLLVRTLGRSKPRGVHTGWNQNSLVAINLLDGKWFGGEDYWRDIHDNAMEIYETGLPAAYSADDASVTALSGDLVLAMEKPEIERMLAGGVYLDGRALTRLNEMGYGSLTGFTVDGWVDQDCAEILTDDPLNGEFVGRRRDCIQSFWNNPCAKLAPLEKSARILARKVERMGDDPDFACMGMFENRRGGRVAVAGYAAWTFLHSFAKASQMKRLFRWLSRDTLPGYIESYHKINLWIRAIGKGRLAAILVNVSMDPAKETVLRLRTTARKAVVYDIKCSGKSIRAAEVDGPYACFNLPPMAPWTMVLVVA